MFSTTEKESIHQNILLCCILVDSFSPDCHSRITFNYNKNIGKIIRTSSLTKKKAILKFYAILNNYLLNKQMFLLEFKTELYMYVDWIPSELKYRNMRYESN